MPSPFYPASVVFFQLHGGIVSHMHVLDHPQQYTILNSWILTMKAYKFWLLLIEAVMF